MRSNACKVRARHALITSTILGGVSALVLSCSPVGSRESGSQRQPLSGDPSQPTCGFAVQPEPTEPPLDPCLHGQSILDPDPVVRSTGEPLTETYAFDLPAPGWICVDAGTSGVSAARITLDGQDLLTPDRFRPQLTRVTERAETSAGSHDLSVWLASSPGSSLDLDVLFVPTDAPGDAPPA